MIPKTYAFTRYLSAKKSVDDRALNRSVCNVFAAALPPKPRILEVGAGIGTMVERLAAWDILKEGVYTAVDAQAENIDAARQRLSQLPQSIELTLETADIFDFAARSQGQPGWDAIIAHAFLDLVDIPQTLPLLFSLLRPGGLYYFTLNFDGATILQPAIDPVFDALVEKLYHETMDQRLVNGRPSGDSRSGRHLFQHLRAAGADIQAAGSSDWVVFAGKKGYKQDEAYFLHFILHTIQQALYNHAELDKAYFDAWIAQRHAQVEAGTLVYIAHQLDFLGRIS